MSGGAACRKAEEHRESWRVRMRNANRSAFSGYHLTPSDYSAVICLKCGASWRTKAVYTARLKDATDKDKRLYDEVVGAGAWSHR